MRRSTSQLRADALRIWRAGVDAVRAERLMRESIRRDGNLLWIGDEELDLSTIDRVIVVGAGKAGAGMSAGLEQALGPELLTEKRVAGWINVPENCVRRLERIHLHGGRPAGVNEPTAEGVQGAEEILRLVEAAGPSDLCVCLLSGGGSALLPAPAKGISLSDKLAVTRFLSAAGANIAELNAVRSQLSRIKGGGLLRACRAGRLISLVISDVIGDPLEVIASGPTVESRSTRSDALAVLEKFGARAPEVPAPVFEFLRREAIVPPRRPTCAARHVIIGNNALAVDAAGVEAERLGYSHAMHAATELEGPAEEVGRHLAEMALSMRDGSGPDCLITGGEPTVRLAPAAIRGKGGRNQQLVLAALERLAADGAHGIAIIAGGTDGEDGPTDAAGAIVTDDVVADAQARGLCPADFLRRNDAYDFLLPLDALVKTGPTETNVCDLRVVVVSRAMDA